MRLVVQRVIHVKMLQSFVNHQASIICLLQQVDNEDLVFTLEAMVEKFGEEIAPYAMQMTQQLAFAFVKYSDAQDDDDDESGG